MFEVLIPSFVSQAVNIASQSLGLPDRIKSSLRRNTVTKKLEVYVLSSLQKVAQSYPDITSNFFDATFLETRGAEAVAQILSRAKRPDPEELTSQWLKQFAFPAIVNEITRFKMRNAAKDFLIYLNEYLMSDPEFRDLFDSLALDRIASDIGSIREKMYEQNPKPKLRCYMFRQEESFSLHDLPAAGSDSAAATITLSMIKNLTNDQIMHDIEVPFHIERWKVNQRMKLFWHLVVDNVGDDLDTDIMLSVRLRQGYILETRTEIESNTKKYVEGEPSLGSRASFKFEKILPGECVEVSLITDSHELHEVDAWSKSMGRFGLSMIYNIQYQAYQPRAQ